MRRDLQLVAMVAARVVIPVVPILDLIIHTVDLPFCLELACECHNRRIPENQEAFNRCIGDPLMAGLLTIDEAQRLFHGRMI
jgi:hypothetical protein